MNLWNHNQTNLLNSLDWSYSSYTESLEGFPSILDPDMMNSKKVDCHVLFFEFVFVTNKIHRRVFPLQSDLQWFKKNFLPFWLLNKRDKEVEKALLRESENDKEFIHDHMKPFFKKETQIEKLLNQIVAIILTSKTQGFVTSRGIDVYIPKDVIGYSLNIEVKIDMNAILGI